MKTFDGYSYTLASFGEFLLVGIKDTWLDGIVHIGTKVQIRSSLREDSSTDIRVTLVTDIRVTLTNIIISIIITIFKILVKINRFFSYI